jgi:lysophospholipase L1-like esterase
MNDREPARGGHRLATMAAYAGGAVSAVAALGMGVLFGQAMIARFTIPGAEAPPPRCDGEYGARFRAAATSRPTSDPGAGSVIRLAVIGDSTAAGYGVRTRAETPGALLATWIATAARRPVRLTCPAVVGSISAWLEPQVETALEAGVDLAIIFIGANDITGRVGEAAAVRHLYEAVSQLRAIGAEVVVATCPDLGTIRPIQPPLRWFARHWSRKFAAAQAIAAVRAGGRTVALGALIGPQFEAAPEHMFGADRYHPSAEGYRAAARAVLPAALAALAALGRGGRTDLAWLADPLDPPDPAGGAELADAEDLGDLSDMTDPSGAGLAGSARPATARTGSDAVPSLGG